jgi:hypothetical protein
VRLRCIAKAKLKSWHQLTIRLSLELLIFLGDQPSLANAAATTISLYSSFSLFGETASYGEI